MALRCKMLATENKPVSHQSQVAGACQDRRGQQPTDLGQDLRLPGEPSSLANHLVLTRATSVADFLPAQEQEARC